MKPKTQPNPKRYILGQINRRLPQLGGPPRPSGACLLVRAPILVHSGIVGCS